MCIASDFPRVCKIMFCAGLMRSCSDASSPGSFKARRIELEHVNSRPDAGRACHAYRVLSTHACGDRDTYFDCSLEPLEAFRDCLEALPVMLYIMIVMAYGFTSLLYLVEPRENMPTVAHAAWLVISTITTVGFGDVVPSTQSGLVLTSVLMVVSSLYMAMPFGIIGHSFTQIWGSRKRILLLQKTRSRLHKWVPGLHLS